VGRTALLVALVATVVACGRDHGVARVRPVPTPDGSPALRGGGQPKSPRIANYKIDVRLDVVNHQLTATQKLTWTNTGQSSVDMLPFHLYLNAFKNESTLFMRSSGGVMRGAKMSDKGWGWIQLESVQVGGTELHDRLTYPGAPNDETVVELPLPAPVAPGATVEVDFRYTAQLPEVFARTGYDGEFHMIGQWFPKIGVRLGTPGAERWECQPFHLLTEFFADFGTYDVAITVPNTYVVAATGVLAGAVDAPGNTRTLTYRAEDVHDFAWMADPYMEVISGKAKVEDSTVEVRVYHRPEQRAFALRHLHAAAATIEKFSTWFVPYPWPIMSIIDPPMTAVAGAGGMEYPTLATTAGDSVFARDGLRLPEFVTVHEVGHNWFQGILASNEPIEPWLDEGVNDWADGRLMAEVYGQRTSAIDWMGWTAEVNALRRAVAVDPGALPSPIATAAYAFVDPSAYAQASYESTLRALSTLEATVGASKFAAAMKAYAREWAFKHPTGRDLFETLSRELGQDLSWFFGPVFQGVGGLRLGLRTAHCRLTHKPRGVFGEGPTRKTVSAAEAPDTGAYVCEVVITNTGTIHVPVDIQLEFADGSRQRLHWDDRGNGNWHRFTFDRSAPLVEVWIDPDQKLALGSPMTNRYRLEGDGSAALRAAAWFANGAQSLMQLVGP
jgi:hypothetical protein